MTIAVVSGGTGFVGRFIVERLLSDGISVRIASRNRPVDGFFARAPVFFEQALDPAADLRALFAGAVFFVHAAFDHLPGRYRGGEGDDPQGFWRRNHLGTLAFFEAAKAAGVRRAVLLSSRAVYGKQQPGAMLIEETISHPDTLYGEVKRACETDVLAMAGDGFVPVCLRVTGVYGPAGQGRRHKWDDLFEDWLAGRDIAPRAGTEVHGDDVAAAVALVLSADKETVSGEIFNVADTVVDRRGLLERLGKIAGLSRPLPARADASALNIMSTEKLRALGWRPGGKAGLEAFLRLCLARCREP